MIRRTFRRTVSVIDTDTKGIELESTRANPRWRSELEQLPQSIRGRKSAIFAGQCFRAHSRSKPPLLRRAPEARHSEDSKARSAFILTRWALQAG